MMVYINKDGYARSPYIKDATIGIDVTDEQANLVNQIPYGKAWRYIDGNFSLEYLMTDDHLREVRVYECFKLIDNKSMMWYNNLTDAQKAELSVWYNAWLNVTDTKVIPTKPEWLR